MKYGNGRIIFEGVQGTFNYKSLFIEYILELRQARKELSKMISESKTLIEKLAARGKVIPQSGAMHLFLTEEELVLVYDELFFEKLSKMNLDKDKYWHEFVPKLQKGEVKINLDTGYFLLYAISTNKECRDVLDKVVERNEYYALWENSQYNTPFLEGYVAVEYIWHLRLLAGILEKVRLEGERGAAYKLFMRILYAGHRDLRRSLKGKKELDGELVKDIICEEGNDFYNMLPTICRAVMLLVIAEDMGLTVCYDAEMLFLLEAYENYQKNVIEKWQNEMIESEHVTEAAVKVREFAQKTKHPDAEYNAFIEKFDQKYASHQSLSELAVAPEETKRLLLFNVMQMFFVNPRKFHGFELTEEECRSIWNLCDEWTPELFWSMLIAAILTKYISRLEKMYISISREYQDFQKWKAEEEKQHYGKLEKRHEEEVANLLLSKSKLEEIIAQQERLINRLQKNVEVQEKTIQTYKQELSTLLAYVNSVHSSSEEVFEDANEDYEERLKEWAEKKVLVIGGHINWQNKLKERFPDWQFVEAKQRTFDDGIVYGKEWVICNTEFLDHSTYYKVVSAIGKSQKLLFVHSNNLAKCMQELEVQLKMHSGCAIRTIQN